VIAAAGGPSGGRSPSLFDTPADRRLAALAWAAALAASFLLIAVFQFRSGDPDSNVYAGISARLAAEPFLRWIAPEWWGQWDFSGPFREHPIGIFILPALAGRLGYPPPQAAYAVNGLFQAASIVLVQVIAVHLVSRRDARALGWIVQLMPIAFVFRIRANQEYAVLAGILLALLATERSRARPAWTWLTALAFAWALLVKGVFGFLVPTACGVWLGVAEWYHRARAGAARSGGDGPSRRIVPWVALTSVLLVAPILTVTYEWAYRTVSGDSFLAFYTGPRLRPDAVAGGAFDRAGYNIVWYTARLAWYAFPWSIVALGAFGRLALGARNRRPEVVDRADGRGVRGLVFAVVASLVLIVLFSFSDRKADRFIFPAYYFMAGAGGAAAIAWSPALSSVVNRLDRPWIPAACWMALFLLRLGTGSHLPQFTFWRS
jgi:4-amino-4-deoxy-L-arabinose transferase-like glycosyltransferase